MPLHKMWPALPLVVIRKSLLLPFPPTLLRYNCHIKLIHLRCTVCWFDTLTCWKMITTIALVNISITSHNCLFFFPFIFLVLRTFKLYSFANPLIHIYWKMITTIWLANASILSCICLFFFFFVVRTFKFYSLGYPWPWLVSGACFTYSPGSGLALPLTSISRDLGVETLLVTRTENGCPSTRGRGRRGRVCEFLFFGGPCTLPWELPYLVPYRHKNCESHCESLWFLFFGGPYTLPWELPYLILA